MHISNLVIKNFRALEDIQIDLSSSVNVVVGPNAIGKTTVLHAVRLAKAIAAPRTPNEAQQTLISLGAASPHFPNRILVEALARDPGKPVEIRCTYKLTGNEIELLGANLSTIATSALQARLGQAFSNPANFIQYASSPNGIVALNQVTDELKGALENLKKNSTIVLGVSFDGRLSRLTAHDPLGAILLTYLDQRLEPHLSVFSYFPADRAMPVGEVPIQLGVADAQQQLESHNSQPQQKYNRLKNTVFNTLLKSENHRVALNKSFERIFSGVLPGRRVLGPRLNELGLMSILVEEIESGRKFEMDSLSSGEKGLILTFLLMALTVENGGIVLLDEPELHLNPAVCSDIIPFMYENYVVPKDLQLIVCSHSPQVLTSVFEQEQFALLHLESPNVVSRVGKRAYDELADAMKRLGVSVSEALLYKGTLLVEGEDDVRLLQDGFGDQLRRFKISDRGGRREVEKTVERLQELERRGEKVDPIYLIFDHDEAPTGLKSSDAVRIMQWGRYCIENYLIDVDAIAELLKSEEIARVPGAKAGELSKELRELAFSQLDELAAREAYRSFGYLSPWFERSDLVGEKEEALGLPQIAENLYRRHVCSRDSMPVLSKDSWMAAFEAQFKAKRAALEVEWEANWKERCNAKRLFSDFMRRGRLKVSLPTFKRRVIQQMKMAGSENWRLVSSLLTALTVEKN